MADKYRVRRAISWKSFATAPAAGDSDDKPTLVDAADLKTEDGKPLPKVVVEHFVSSGGLELVKDEVTEGVTG